VFVCDGRCVWLAVEINAAGLSIMAVHMFPGRHHLDRRALALIEEANVGTDDELLSTPRTAVWLSVSPQWLEIGRCKGWGPPFIKLSPRRVRYRVGTVKKWLADRSYRRTAEYDTPDIGQPAPDGVPIMGASSEAAKREIDRLKGMQPEPSRVRVFLYDADEPRVTSDKHEFAVVRYRSNARW
jgi:hypothetical protein